MGLNVKTYGNINLSNNRKDANFLAHVVLKKWDYKIKNLENEKYYKGNIIFDGISYSYFYHNRFREKLIRLINREDLLNEDGKINWNILPDDIPFYEFIDFSDCDGCLDFEVSEKIYSDFKNYNKKAELEMNEYDYFNYLKWLETFRFSKKHKGVVVFS